MLRSALHLAWSLIRIPRLFASLFLIPIVLSLGIVVGQVLATAVLVKALDRSTESVSMHYEVRKQTDLGRRLVLGTNRDFGPPLICRWTTVTRASGSLQEVPPSPACNPDRLDLAIRVSEPDLFDTSKYESIFNGLVERIHVCRTCRPDAVITVGESGIRSDAYSPQALILLRLTLHNTESQEKFLAAMKSLDEVRRLLGDVHLHSHGLRDSLNTSRMEATLAVCFNIAILVVISLWLAIKAHRKVLDYFARNGALLPMVAATGHREFYGALWILTLLRVGFFLAAAIPLAYFGILSVMKEEELLAAFRLTLGEFLLWLVALMASLSLATVVASIADLKHRHGLLSFCYKYIPLVFCLLGSTVWLLSFLFTNTTFGILRNIITAIPIAGTAPVLLTPALQPHGLALAVHAVFTMVFLLSLLKSNARWFAAHLEEL